MLTDHPVVSVILTSFNHGKFIREAIESALSQTFVNFELIIWDDASPDDSWEIIQGYRDPRIRAYQNKHNEGPATGINKAIFEMATGKYISIHHSDDVWEFDKLEKQVAFLDARPEVGAVFTWTKVINENGLDQDNDHFSQPNRSRWQWLNSIFFMNSPFAHPSIMIRKACYQELGGYRDYLAQTPDVEMWSRLLLAYPVHIIPERLTKHRLFSDNSNTSGARPDVVVRTWNEWNVLRENFLSISNFETIVAIFPDLERFRSPKGFDSKFLLAMACLYGTTQKNAWHLGLRWLFDIFGDERRAKEIERIYEFTYKDIIRISATFDIYNLVSPDYVVELQKGKDWLESQWLALQAELKVRDSQLHEESGRLERLRSALPVRVLRKIGAISDD
jgi:glycosyltransferase involved in cell wall biosynthesis